MIPRRPSSTRHDALFPYTPLFRSPCGGFLVVIDGGSNRAGRGGCGHRLGASRMRRFDASQRGSLATARFQGAAAATIRACIAGVVSTLPCTSISSTSLRSEEHTSELQSLMRISYAVFCLKKKNKNKKTK